MFEQVPVGVGRGVVELVDDDDIEVVRREMAQVPQTLHGREHVLELHRPAAVAPHLSERSVAQVLAERRTGLLEQFLAVGDEQQPGAR